MTATQVVIDYAPRKLQRLIHDALEHHRFSAVVCHRRFGKTVMAINHLIRAAMTCTKTNPRFAYIGPYFNQAKDIAWTYLKHYSSPIPGCEPNESELRVNYPNGAQVRLYGADNPDRLRGLYFDGVVLDEYGLMPPRIYGEVVRPTLSDRQGTALFMGTPNGRNQFYRIINGDPETGFVGARHDPAWFFAEYKASETGVVPPEELKSARQSMTGDEYAQEYECSFEASVKGAIYGRELASAREHGQFTRVPYDPAILVETDWDLGFGDLTALWFSQTIRHTGEVRLIDYHEAKEGLPYFVSLLKAKGYTYGEHWAPHDIELKEMSGNSRLKVARDLGINFLISPKVERIEDGIHAARLLLPRCYFDTDRCQNGLEALHNYRWKLPSVKDPTGRPLPVHDWASHGADAFRGLAYRHYVRRRSPEREAAIELRKAQADPTEKFTWSRPRSGRGGY